jgi:hypothetical protein
MNVLVLAPFVDSPFPAAATTTITTTLNSAVILTWTYRGLREHGTTPPITNRSRSSTTNLTTTGISSAGAAGVVLHHPSLRLTPPTAALPKHPSTSHHPQTMPSSRPPLRPPIRPLFLSWTKRHPSATTALAVCSAGLTTILATHFSLRALGFSSSGVRRGTPLLQPHIHSSV